MLVCTEEPLGDLEHTSIIPQTLVQIRKHLLPSARVLSACVCLSVYVHPLAEMIDLFLYMHRNSRVFPSNGNGQVFVEALGCGRIGNQR